MLETGRDEFAYTPFYCEENIWHLAGHPSLAERPRRVVFISNPSKSCALWAQKASEDPTRPVVWDYHVVLWIGPKSDEPGPWILDFDTRLGFPVSAETYLRATFPLGDEVRVPYRPFFRVVDADDMRRVFRSDRRHMQEDDLWLRPPPPWPPIGGSGSNLSDFVDMETPGLGEVFGWTEFRQKWCLMTPTGSTPHPAKA